MKKIYIIFSCVLQFLVSNCFAQPTLTASGINPVVGEQITTHYTQYVDPGNAGASQIWDLSTMDSSGSATATVILPSSTPYTSSFPQANIAGYDGSVYAYQKTSSGAWQNYGWVSPQGTIGSYSDPEDFLHFPFTYNNTYDDYWAVTFVSGGETYYRTGNTTVTADGYGTLITPKGTFNNVLRIHFVQTYQDSANIMGDTIIYNYLNDEYMWYSEGFHLTLAAVWIFATPFGTSTQGAYSFSSTTGINENEAFISCNLYPNPSTGELYVNIHSNTNQEAEILLFDTKGILVEMPLTDLILQGSNEYKFNVAELPDGIYFTSVILNGTISSTQRFTIAK